MHIIGLLSIIGTADVEASVTSLISYFLLKGSSSFSIMFLIRLASNLSDAF
jgi:acyl-CoA thioesterase